MVETGRPITFLITLNESLKADKLHATNHDIWKTGLTYLTRETPLHHINDILENENRKLHLVNSELTKQLHEAQEKLNEEIVK